MLNAAAKQRYTKAEWQALRQKNELIAYSDIEKYQEDLIVNESAEICIDQNVPAGPTDSNQQLYSSSYMTKSIELTDI